MPTIAEDVKGEELKSVHGSFIKLEMKCGIVQSNSTTGSLSKRERDGQDSKTNKQNTNENVSKGTLESLNLPK